MKRRSFLKLIPAPLALAVQQAWPVTLPFVLGQQLMFAAANNFGPIATTTNSLSGIGSGPVNVVCRFGYVLGGGDLSELVVNLLQWYMQNGTGMLAVGNDFTVSQMALEYNGTYTPVYWSGSRTKLITNGSTNILSDAITPAMLGATKFAQGDIVYLRTLYQLANAATDSLVYTYGNALQGVCLKWRPSSDFQLTNGIDSTGTIQYDPHTAVGNVDYGGGNTFMPILLGRFVSGKPKSVFVTGDSTAYGTGESSSTAVGAIGLMRALYNDANSAAGAYAGCNFGNPGGRASDWAGGLPARITAYLKYANCSIEEYGHNNINVSDSQAIHALMRAGLVGNKHIIRPSLSTTTTSSDAFATTANQTIDPSYDAGGIAEVFNDAMKALAASDLTYIETLGDRAASTRGSAGSNFYKWAVNGLANYSTVDGVHPGSQGYELRVRSNGNITRAGGVTTTGTMRSILVALP